MAAKWRSFTKEEIFEFAAISRANSEFLRKMGYAGRGGNATIVMQAIQAEYPDLDLSHFVHEAWNKNQFDYSRFKKGVALRGSNMVDALAFQRGRKCECCGLSEWLSEPIKLEVHHIDGNHLNNEIDNLMLLCPNCHAQTDNWRAKNIKNKAQQVVSEEEFAEALKSTPNIRQALLKLGLTPSGANYERAYAIKEKFKI